MDSVSHFDDIQMRTVAEGDDDSVMDVTLRMLRLLHGVLLLVSRRGSCGLPPLSGISGLTGGWRDRFVQRAFVVLRGCLGLLWWCYQRVRE